MSTGESLEAPAGRSRYNTTEQQRHREAEIARTSQRQWAAEAEAVALRRQEHGTQVEDGCVFFYAALPADPPGSSLLHKALA
jgi:hypothetical protein